MSKILLFVHGTGVRGPAYAATSALIERNIKRYQLKDVSLAPCLWGEKFGAELAFDGQSIPSYGQSRSGYQAIEDTSPAVWQLLLQDPTFELSAFASMQASKVPAPSGQTSLESLIDRYRLLSSSEEFRTELVDMGLDYLVEENRINSKLRNLVAQIAQSEGFQNCARSAVAAGARHRSALARAIVAGIQKMAIEDGIPLLDAGSRDELVMRLAHLLTAEKFDVISASLAPLKGIMAGLATWQGRRKRTSLTDATFPAAGDILRYQRHGKDLREYLRESIAAHSGDEVYVLAHSLGGVASFETLVAFELPNVKQLITFGSQAPFFYEINALETLPVDKLQPHLPKYFPAWSNFYDLNDPLSYVGEKIFKGRVIDHKVESGESFPASHSAYLHSAHFWEMLAKLVNHA